MTVINPAFPQARADSVCGVNGILLLDKPAGITSNRALQRARRAFSGAKAGHTGTLDPLASGLLPICFGEATKFSQSLLDSEKTYEAVVRLGWRSSTGDAEGELTEGSTPPDESDTRLAGIAARFTGEILQIPPMYSALKRNGKPLYQLARQGVTVDRAPRKIQILRLSILRHERDRLAISVSCSKGTYIRVLAEDIGEALGCGAYLEQLRRTAVAGFVVEKSIALDALEATPPDARPGLLEPVDAMVAGLPRVELGPVEAGRIRQGQAAAAVVPSDQTGNVRLYGPQETFIGIGEVRSDGLVHPKRLVSQAIGQTISP
jgi:tRNA pseudouridine55 synthase